MGQYLCPSCRNVVEADGPGQVQCHVCGFGFPKGQAPRPASPVQPAVPAYPAQPAMPAYPPPPAAGPYAVPRTNAPMQAHPVPYGYAPPPTGYGVYGAPPGYMPGAAYAPMMKRSTSGMGIASMIVGVVGVCSSFTPLVLWAIVPALVALGLGAGGIAQTKKNPAIGGRGLAVAGLVLGIVQIAMAVIWIVFFPRELDYFYR